jgi:hypothetical protein
MAYDEEVTMCIASFGLKIVLVVVVVVVTFCRK